MCYLQYYLFYYNLMFRYFCCENTDIFLLHGIIKHTHYRTSSHMAFSTRLLVILEGYFKLIVFSCVVIYQCTAFCKTAISWSALAEHQRDSIRSNIVHAL